MQNLELEVKESQEKARQSLEEQTKLVGEKNQLLQTVKKLNRDVAKLENFKRSLLQQLQDDDEVLLPRSSTAHDSSCVCLFYTATILTTDA